MFHSETGVTDQSNSFGAKYFTLKPISLLLITVLHTSRGGAEGNR